MPSTFRLVFITIKFSAIVLIIMCSPINFVQSGAGGFPAWGIEPNSELLFEIEVLSFN